MTLKQLEGKRWFIWALVIVVVSLVGLASYITYVAESDSANQGFGFLTHITLQNKPDLSVGLKTYKSTSLGLSFKYWQAGGVIITEKDNRISIYPKVFPEYQKFIQVFQKDPSQTLTQAIQAQLLPGQPSSCEVKNINIASRHVPRAFDQIAEIVDTNHPAVPNSCGYYANFATDAAFAYSSDYPDRFYFYDFGQDSWPNLTSDNSGDFRDTIKIIK